eukprot:Gb_02615 [translate_table: standard]
MKTIKLEEKLASSVAWNTEMESMLCYSGNGMLNIKTADFPVHVQKLQGYVVGFQGSRIFCLHQSSIQTIEVPQSSSMKHFLERGQYVDAYKVACLGVTEADWKTLGLGALQGWALEIAHSCFRHIQDVCFLDLVHKLRQEGCPGDQKPMMALIQAYQGRYEAAAQIYCEAGMVEKAMEMFADLHMFEEAKALAEKAKILDGNRQANVQEIIQKQAEWTEETNDHATAADMYIVAGQPEKALLLIAEHGPPSKLIEVARRLKKTDIQELSLCAKLMHQYGLNAHAFETYTKIGDFRSVLSLHMELEQWDDAFAIKRLHPELEDDVFLQYADWLILKDQFKEAHKAYKQAGRHDLSSRLLKQLIKNAVSCSFSLSTLSLKHVI